MGQQDQSLQQDQQDQQDRRDLRGLRDLNLPAQTAPARQPPPSIHLDPAHPEDH